MPSFTSFLSVAHLVGLALAVGSATLKLVLLVKCRTDATFVPVYLKVAGLITRHILLGMILLTLSGIGWLMLGYAITPRLVLKLILVAAIFAIGPVIDKVMEPRFAKFAPGLGERVSPEFIRAENQYLAVEFAATALFYVVIFIWVLG